jgi:hypothetical protein
MRRFSASDEPPPADWLCVFDPLIRYSKPGCLDSSSEEGPYFDPFDAYGLDSDPVPPKIAPDDPYTKREVPSNVWDCFAPTRLDRQNLRDHHFSALKGPLGCECSGTASSPRTGGRLDREGIESGRGCVVGVRSGWSSPRHSSSDSIWIGAGEDDEFA